MKVEAKYMRVYFETNKNVKNTMKKSMMESEK